MLDDSEYKYFDWDYVVCWVMLLLFRDQKYQDSLWVGFVFGLLQVVVIDYCVFIIDQKCNGINDFIQIFNGIGGLEDCLLMLWIYGVNIGWLILNEFVVVILINIVKILNVYLKKGVVLVGVDVDIVVWDLMKEKMIIVLNQELVIDYNVFEGKKVKGLLCYIFICGWVVVEDGMVNY